LGQLITFQRILDVGLRSLWDLGYDCKTHAIGDCVTKVTARQRDKENKMER
jgi:hypothetical protein